MHSVFPIFNRMIESENNLFIKLLHDKKKRCPILNKGKKNGKHLI